MLTNMLNSIFKRKSRNYLTFEEIQTVQLIVQQTVILVNGTAGVPESDKAGLAFTMAEDLLKDIGIQAPPFLVETVVDASIMVLQERSAGSKEDYHWRTHIISANKPRNANSAA